MKKVCHITTVHHVFDTRIFYKEAQTLAKAGYDVTLIAQHDKNEVIDGITIIALPKPRNRIFRMLFLTKKAYKLALSQKADIYHFHDPELLPWMIKLKRKTGAKVIYDVHEDVPQDILSKNWIPKIFRKFISKFFEIYEDWASERFDWIITATPFIRYRFLRLNINTIDINNYPLIEEFMEPVLWDSRKNEICYIGGISRIRGIVELVKALEYTETVLHLAGEFESKDLEEQVKSLKGWKKVKYYGYIDRKKMVEILNTVRIGIVCFLPESNHIYSQPNKLFEYISAGIPVIASNFTLWKEILEGNNCGICVNPLEHKEIAEAIEYLINHQEEAKKMGENGRKAVLEKYNWEAESKKLLKVYEELLSK
jgi:glycosyltransferase involved in cell wall biosynthesis